MHPTDITRDDIAKTEAVIRPHIRRTPTLAVDAADSGLSAQGRTLALTFIFVVLVGLACDVYASIDARGGFVIQAVVRNDPKTAREVH